MSTIIEEYARVIERVTEEHLEAVAARLGLSKAELCAAEVGRPIGADIARIAALSEAVAEIRSHGVPLTVIQRHIGGSYRRVQTLAQRIPA